MDTITESGMLVVGVVVDGVVHRDFTVRQAMLSDAYRAAESVGVPDDVDDNKAKRVAYQMAVDDAQVLWQLVSLGTLTPVPRPEALVEELDPDDMVILRKASISVKKKLIALRQASGGSETPNVSSSEKVSG